MNFTLNVLGTASALPTTERYPSAQVLDVRGRLFMIDCGEGAQMQLRRAKVSFQKIEHLCLSHIHGDHLFGIFGLLSTMGMLGRSSVLNIYAPKTFRPVLDFFMQHFGEGVKYEINLVELDMSEPEIVYENRTVELLSFPLRHRGETYGFIIREKVPPYNVYKEAIGRYGLSLAEIGTLKRGEDVVRGDRVIPHTEAAYRPYEPRSYAYCSDTAPFPELATWVKGVSLLYHEATYPAEMSEMAEKNFHSTTVQAASVAREAGVDRLLVGHYSSRFPSVDFYLDELRSIFPESYLAKDGDMIDVPHVIASREATWQSSK
ncbi:MAG: ribonuclease Z [Bacteroidales bacterium]|nr:ribonuclease Z [Bacteroidales bacterium]